MFPKGSKAQEIKRDRLEVWQGKMELFRERESCGSFKSKPLISSCCWDMFQSTAHVVISQTNKKDILRPEIGSVVITAAGSRGIKRQKYLYFCYWRYCLIHLYYPSSKYRVNLFTTLSIYISAHNNDLGKIPREIVS